MINMDDSNVNQEAFATISPLRYSLASSSRRCFSLVFTSKYVASVILHLETNAGLRKSVSQATTRLSPH